MNFLLLCVFHEKTGVEFSAGDVVVLLSDVSFMTSNGMIVKINDVLSNIITDDLTLIDQTSKLVICAEGSRFWYKNDVYHRDDGPAIEWANGTREWYKNDRLHRDDGPAYEGADGVREWYKNDQLHRDDGPVIEYVNGMKQWYKNVFRVDGPEIVQTDKTRYDEFSSL